MHSHSQVGNVRKYTPKPIYDIPGYPSILAAELVDNLMEQIKPFKPGFTLGESAETIDKNEDGQFIVTTVQGTKHQAPIVAIAGGLGFTPRKPPVPNLSKFENNGIHYIVKEPSIFNDKNLVISGGGDSALDWALYFAENNAKSVTLIHRAKKL